MLYSLLGGLATIMCSVLGSVSGVFIKKISHKTNDMLLGYAAGVMLAAAFVGLLPDAFGGGSAGEILVGTAGILAGAVCLSLADRFIPHSHFNGDEFSDSAAKSKHNASRVLLLVIAIAIHNIPEGLATGMALTGGITKEGLTVLFSMMLQKVPEGLIVSLPLISLGMKKSKALLCSVGVAMMMLPGVLFGILFGMLPQLLSVFFTAFTFGTIVYVISDEVIPESHANGHQKAATFSLLGGILRVSMINFLV